MNRATNYTKLIWDNVKKDLTNVPFSQAELDLISPISVEISREFLEEKSYANYITFNFEKTSIPGAQVVKIEVFQTVAKITVFDSRTNKEQVKEFYI